MNQKFLWAASALLLACTGAAKAADWSDTAISVRYGTAFAEPYNNNADGSRKDIKKAIVALTHASGYKYGTNFFNADLLLSDAKDPSYAGSDNGAHEVYVVYRHMLDLGKVTGANFKFGPVRGLGLTGGFDFNTKTDAGYNSKKRMLVLGPTVMFDVPGFLNVSLLALWESNAPYSTFSHTGTSRYHYDTHPMLTAAWGIPLGAGFSLEGFANWIAAKGTNEFGGGTKPETNIDAQVMYDASSLVGAANNTFRIGLEYQYWRNKFGNPTVTPGAGPGATARTPMIRVDYHF